MRRCVIVGGADIGNYERVSAYVGEDDYASVYDIGGILSYKGKIVK